MSKIDSAESTSPLNQFVKTAASCHSQGINTMVEPSYKLTIVEKIKTTKLIINIIFLRIKKALLLRCTFTYNIQYIHIIKQGVQKVLVCSQHSRSYYSSLLSTENINEDFSLQISKFYDENDLEINLCTEEEYVAFQINKGLEIKSISNPLYITTSLFLSAWSFRKDSKWFVVVLPLIRLFQGKVHELADLSLMLHWRFQRHAHSLCMG